jgi:hypothetical protein
MASPGPGEELMERVLRARRYLFSAGPQNLDVWRPKLRQALRTLSRRFAPTSPCPGEEITPSAVSNRKYLKFPKSSRLSDLFGGVAEDGDDASGDSVIAYKGRTVDAVMPGDGEVGVGVRAICCATRAATSPRFAATVPSAAAGEVVFRQSLVRKRASAPYPDQPRHPVHTPERRSNDVETTPAGAPAPPTRASLVRCW